MSMPERVLVDDVADVTVSMALNGPLLKKQRSFLYRIADEVDVDTEIEKHEAVEGLISLIEYISDIAHDEFNLDCLFTSDEVCAINKKEGETK